MASPYRHQKTQLDNGLGVVTVAMPHLHTATVSLFVRVGSRHETPETNGLSHFLEHMFFRGCDGFPDSTALNSAVEDLGGTLDGFTMRDYSAYQTTVHPAYVGDATEILGQMFLTPSFRDIEIERAIILEEILDAFDDRGRMIDIDAISHRESFPAHPLGQTIDGPRKNIRRFGVDDLKRHRKRFYGARNMVLCFAGNVDPAKCRRAAETTLGAHLPGLVPKETPPKLNPRAPRFVYVHSDDAQSRARLSFRTVADVHPDYPALLLLRRVLDGGLSARLQVEMVEKRGIAYEIGADLETYSDAGLFDFEFVVAHKKLGYAFTELFEVLVGLKRRGVSAEELDSVRRRARFSVEFSLDSPAELGQWFGATELFHPPKTPEERLAELDRVTPEDLLDVAERYFSADRLSIAVVGGAEPELVKAVKKTVGEAVSRL